MDFINPLGLSGTRFRADYVRRIVEAADGTVHALSFPVVGGEEFVGRVVERPGQDPVAYDEKGEVLASAYSNVDRAIVAVIEHDQAKHNH